MDPTYNTFGFLHQFILLTIVGIVKAPGNQGLEQRKREAEGGITTQEKGKAYITLQKGKMI